MDQTPDRDESPSGKDGTIYCLDLSHAEAQTKASTLAQAYEEVASILRSRNGNMQYLLVMMPTSKPTEAVAMLAKHPVLIDGLSIIYARSKDFGEDFEIVIIPASSHVADLWKTVRADA